MAVQSLTSSKMPWTVKTYRYWLGANALAEIIGLGGTAFVGYFLFARLTEPSESLLFSLLIILSGILLEGVAVALLQWSVLRTVLPKLRLRLWVLATSIGAGIAWTLGMIPSTLMNSVAEPSSIEEPSKFIVLLLAFAMGLILGPVLGLPQYFVLKPLTRRAGWWVGANSLAWALGMLVIFAGIDLALQTSGLALFGSLILTFGLCGLIVATIHGLFLFFILNM